MFYCSHQNKINGLRVEKNWFWFDISCVWVRAWDWCWKSEWHAICGWQPCIMSECHYVCPLSWLDKDSPLWGKATLKSKPTIRGLKTIMCGFWGCFWIRNCLFVAVECLWHIFACYDHFIPLLTPIFSLSSLVTSKTCGNKATLEFFTT